MDHKDRQIIRALQTDGRMTNQDLAKRVNLSPSPCLRRLRNLENSGIIRGYSVDVDPKSYGLPISVFIRVRLDHHNAAEVEAFESKMHTLDQVLECYIMAGASDYLLRVIAANLEDYEKFVRKHLHSIGCIASLDSSFAYGTVKQTRIFPHVVD